MALGFSAAVPIGPVNLLIMAASLQSMRSGMIVGFGALSADIVYLSLILFGIFAYIGTPLFIDFVSFFGAIFMFFMAWIVFVKRNSSFEKTSFAPRNCITTYLNGFLITLLSPYTIAFWVSASSFASREASSSFAMIAGMICAILLWILVLPLFVHKTRGAISPKIAKIFAVVSSLIMAWIGARLALSLL